MYKTCKQRVSVPRAQFSDVSRRCHVAKVDREHTGVRLQVKHPHRCAVRRPPLIVRCNPGSCVGPN
eukprot:3400112-Prymnesium_polylepis.2